MASKPMSGNRIASIIIAVRAAYEYGMAASLNSNSEEKNELVELMFNRLRAATDLMTNERSEAA